MIEFRRLGIGTQHEVDAATLKEGEVGCLEEVLQAERVAVEAHRAGQLPHPHGDLADGLEQGSHGTFLSARPSLYLVSLAN